MNSTNRKMASWSQGKPCGFSCVSCSAYEAPMYRGYLYDEWLARAVRDFFASKRILEIGPKDGLDSKRLLSFQWENHT